LGNRWGIQSKFFIIPVIASILIFGVIGFGLSSDAFAKGQGQPKVTICHVDQETGEEKTISISNKAVSKHLANHIGDHSGECVDVPEPVCGDGNQEAPEECDDGNTVTESCNYSETNCTVCASDCSNQDGATSFCGDSNIDMANGETCDDGANNGTPESCNATCDGMVPAAVCGNGILEAGETCDIGNTDPLLGCPFCQLPTGTGPLLLFICVCDGGINIFPNICVEDSVCTPIGGKPVCDVACQEELGVDSSFAGLACQTGTGFCSAD